MRAPRISLSFRDASLNVLAELEQEKDQDAVVWFCLVSWCELQYYTVKVHSYGFCGYFNSAGMGWDHTRVGPGYTNHSCLYNSSSAHKIDTLFKLFFLICQQNGRERYWVSELVWGTETQENQPSSICIFLVQYCTAQLRTPL